MKTIVVLIALISMPLLNARTIKIINNTGATVLARTTFPRCEPLERKIPSNATEQASTDIPIGNCCFTNVQLSMFDGPHRGKSATAIGERGGPGDTKTCVDVTTFIVEIKDGELKWFRK